MHPSVIRLLRLRLTSRSRHKGAGLGAHQYQPFRGLLREYRSRRPGFQKKRLSSIDRVERAGRLEQSDTVTSLSSFLCPFLFIFLFSCFSSNESLSWCLMVWVSSGQPASLKQSMSRSVCFCAPYWTDRTNLSANKVNLNLMRDQKIRHMSGVISQ